MSRSAPATLALLALLVPASAAAQSTVGVLGVEVTSGPNAWGNCLVEQLRSQVKQRPGYALGASKDLAEIKLVFGCINEEPDCLARVGRSLGAQKLLWGSLQPEGTGFTLTLQLLDVATARLEGSAAATASKADMARGCGKAAMDKVAGQVLRSRFGKLVLEVNVPGAQVLVGSTVVTAPEEEPVVLADLPPGTYPVRVSKQGYQPFVQEVTVQAGEETRLSVELSEEAVAVTPPPDVAQPPAVAPAGGGSGWKIAFWTSAALTVGFGVTLGVSGYKVLEAQDEKDSFIGEWRRVDASRSAQLSSSDVCEDPALTGADRERMDTICSRGETYSTVTNVFIGLTVAAAAASGFFYYKAYVAKSDTEAPAPSTASKRRNLPWIVAPSIGPTGGGVGLLVGF